jgi:type I restriction enzyme R subunit
VNDLFEGDLPDDDKLVYVSNVIAGKRLESGILVQQAANNTKERLATASDLDQEALSAIMSKQAIDSERVPQGLEDILLGPGPLYEALRSQKSETG